MHTISSSGIQTTNVFFINKNIGWIGGTFGKIYKSTDGGINWANHTITSNTSYDFIHFFDENIGIISGTVSNAGGNRNIIKTTDGGLTFQDIVIQSDFTPQKMFVTMNNQIWIVGKSGKIFNSLDSGKTWVQSSIGTTEDLQDIYFISQNTGWVLLRTGSLYKTTDGGLSWNMINNAISTKLLNQVIMFDEQNGIIIANGKTMLKTNDGGLSLNIIGTSIGQYFMQMFFVDNNKGWVVNFDGSIYGTTDGGENWTSQLTGSGTMLLGIYFLNDSTGWACGDGGNVYYTTTGGYTDVEDKNTTNIEDFNVYPNPVSDILNISINTSGFSILKLSIYNEFGQEIITDNKLSDFGNNSFSYNVSNLSNGPYLLKLQSNNFTKMEKFIVVK